ncbi:MAG: MoaD/ThiS family protein [Planctomycetes bacterium]|nr:MoaD/ThiS family protein [Planctomycetota bacterium]
MQPSNPLPSIHVPITIHIKVFAGLREGLSCDRVSFSHPGPGQTRELTAGRIKSFLAASHPNVAVLIQSSRLAVNHTFVDDDASLELALASGVEIALIPPVSGG